MQNVYNPFLLLGLRCSFLLERRNCWIDRLCLLFARLLEVVSVDWRSGYCGKEVWFRRVRY